MTEPVTHYYFGTDIPIAGPVASRDEMAAQDIADFTGDGPSGWIIVGLALMAWAMVIGGVWLVMR